jgi:hypothetical protein
MPRRKMTPWFKDSRTSKIKIIRARKNENWPELQSAVRSLQLANKQRFSLSKNGRRVRVLETYDDIDEIEDGGRYLVCPPLVARNATDLQTSLDEMGFSTIVLCREPKTKMGLCPIVTLGDNTTVRSQIKEPRNPNKPTVGWFDSGTNELGRTVVEKIDTFATDDRKLDYLLGHLCAVPAYDGLYLAIITICDALIESNE